MYCYVCDTDVPTDISGYQVLVHDLRHCVEGQHCTSQDPACGTDTGPGRDHEKPFRCCICKVMVGDDESRWPARAWLYGTHGYALSRAREISARYRQRVWVYRSTLKGELVWVASLDPKRRAVASDPVPRED